MGKFTVFDAFGKQTEIYPKVDRCGWYNFSKPCILYFKNGSKKTLCVPVSIFEYDLDPLSLIEQTTGYNDNFKTTVTLYSLDLVPVRVWDFIGTACTRGEICIFTAEKIHFEICGCYSVVTTDRNSTKRGCDTCNHEPTNHGQRCECPYDAYEDSCNEKNNYKDWEPLPPGHKFPNFCT